ncbi:substrate-binding periplasmic protein [Pseudomonas soli]|uniref:substrate-binding periplasmic protein n=1 Tax=Pseudomonas soli TaxID=1306993 RepID=UPI0009DD7CB2
MRRVLAILLLWVSLWATHGLAQPPVLRFSIAESWSMPLMRIEDQQPAEGILLELMQAIAREVDARPQYHVLARMRLQEAMQAGEIDIRCYVSTQWLTDRPGDYLWSIPLIEQRDLLVGRPGDSGPVSPDALPPQAIGTVLGYTYPTLEPLFSQARLQREDSRNQLLVLQKLQVGRLRHAVSNQLSLQWYNRSLPPAQHLQPLAVLEEQALGCMVRNDPALPTQAVLRALVRIKQSGEMQRIVERYTEPHPFAGDDSPQLPAAATPSAAR